VNHETYTNSILFKCEILKYINISSFIYVYSDIIHTFIQLWTHKYIFSIPLLSMKVGTYKSLMTVINMVLLLYMVISIRLLSMINSGYLIR